MSCLLPNNAILVGKTLQLFRTSLETTDTTSKRVSTEKIALDTKGIKEDKFYGKDLHRSVLLTSTSSYRLAGEHGIDLSYGALGENILMDYTPYDLDAGTQIQIGEVLLEIVQHCTLCKGLSTLDSRLPKLLQRDRGVFAKVIQEGFISLEDEIYIIDRHITLHK